MGSSSLAAMVERIRRVAAIKDCAALADGELLECFLAQGDEASRSRRSLP
jgi:hypothetical protein